MDDPFEELLNALKENTQAVQQLIQINNAIMTVLIEELADDEPEDGGLLNG